MQIRSIIKVDFAKADLMSLRTSVLVLKIATQTIMAWEAINRELSRKMNRNNFILRETIHLNAGGPHPVLF